MNARAIDGYASPAARRLRCDYSVQGARTATASFQTSSTRRTRRNRFDGVEVSARDVSTLLPGSEFRNAWLFVARGFSACIFSVADGDP